MRSTSDESSVPIKPSAIAAAWARFMTSTLKICGVCAAQYSSRGGVDDVVAIDDLERVDRGLTAHDTVERAVAHKHVDRMIDGLGRNERTSAIVNGDVFKARAGTACTPARVES